TKLFAEMTAKNIDKPIGIYLDGVRISAPTVREAIRDGKAEISGQFTLDEAKALARDLNLGALPVPITLVSTETIGATLGESALQAGVKA
ncbi:SecDF P1 head subdomain-containing protein, partial [Streptococcus pneumoniae]|uniref:SecDF P1 head subdomain-containing protein n=1 Tax=Streptococcus pneumoniae TaxID=1313 RepID=UPI0039B6FEBD